MTLKYKMLKIKLEILLRDAKDFDDLFFGLSDIVEEWEE